jgi:hypothetical protein
LCARFKFALVAQLDRASDFESEGREFESLRARHKINDLDGKTRGHRLPKSTGLPQGNHREMGTTWCPLGRMPKRR